MGGKRTQAVKPKSRLILEFHPRGLVNNQKFLRDCSSVCKVVAAAAIMAVCKGVKLIQTRVGKLAVAAVALSISFGTGAIWAGGAGRDEPTVPPVTNSVDEAAVAADLDERALAAAEADLNDAQGEYDRAMADLYSPTPSRTAVRDPEMQMGERHAIELNEQICKQTGQNCELARMARRQYEERYGR
jgi:hypothetical protein